MNVPSDTSRSSNSREYWVLALLVIGFALLYAFTAQRGVSWGDSGLYQFRMLSRNLSGPYGLATSHPLYIILGSAFSSLFAGTARFWAMNAMSGLFMALAVGGTFCCVKTLTHSMTASLLAALTLGCSHMIWWLSTLAEVYTLSLFFITAETYCLIKTLRSPHLRGFLLLAFLNGLHLSAHNFALLAWPVYLVAFIWHVRRIKSAPIHIIATLICGCALWMAGSSPLLILAVRDYLMCHDWAATVESVLVDRYGKQVSGFGGVSWIITLFNFAISGMSLLLPCWIFAIWPTRIVHGMRRLKRVHAEILFLLALFLVHFLFWVRYRVADQATFILPTLFFAILLSAPAFRTIRKPVMWACATFFSAIAIPAIAATLLNAICPSSVRPALPFRNEWNYFALPWKNAEKSAERFADAAIRELPPNSFVYADCNDIGPMACARIDGRLQDGIIFSLAWANDSSDHDISPSSRWEVRPFGIYRLSPPEATVVKRGTFYEVILP